MQNLNEWNRVIIAVDGKPVEVTPIDHQTQAKYLNHGIITTASVDDCVTGNSVVEAQQNTCPHCGSTYYTTKYHSEYVRS